LNRVSRETRQNALDLVAIEQIYWAGKLEDTAFLGRIFDLSALPSTDGRFVDALGDIRQHRESNYDWPDNWIFSDSRFDLLECSDETFLKFVTEMLHPVVRPDAEEARRLGAAFSEIIGADGFELIEGTKIGGRPIWAVRQRSLGGSSALAAVRSARDTFDAEYVSEQITRMEAAIDADPELAIGTAKELVEGICWRILEARQARPEGSPDLPKLVRLVAEDLRLLPDHAEGTRDPDAIRKILGSLSTVVGGIAELRNSYGTGHGRTRSSGLGPRHAKLAVGAASTLAVFLFETYQERDLRDRGAGD
jgi:hypothetical protein